MALSPSTSKMSVHEKAFFSPYHSSQVLNKLADLWRLGKMCDATICVGYTIRIKVGYCQLQVDELAVTLYLAYSTSSETCCLVLIDAQHWGTSEVQDIFYSLSNFLSEKITE